MQVHYSAAVASRPKLSLKLIGVAGIILVGYLGSGQWQVPGAVKWGVLVVFLLAVLNSLSTERAVARSQDKEHGRLLLDFQQSSFFYYRTVYDPPEEISYVEILTYYVQAGSEDDYDRPRRYLGIQFRKRPAIELDVKHLDMDPQRIIGFIETKMEWVYTQQEHMENNSLDARDLS